MTPCDPIIAASMPCYFPVVFLLLSESRITGYHGKIENVQRASYLPCRALKHLAPNGYHRLLCRNYTQGNALRRAMTAKRVVCLK
jgi:hypothetical protein